MFPYKISGLGILFILLAYGCFSITVNFSGAKVPEGSDTFSVGEFINSSSDIQPGLAYDMTEALRNKIESQTRLKLTNGVGDINFEGEIYKYTVTPKSLTQEQVAENRFTIGVKITFTSVYEPENDFTKSFDRYEDFQGSESIESVRDDLTEKIMENIIDDIFKEAFVNW